MLPGRPSSAIPIAAESLSRSALARLPVASGPLIGREADVSAVEAQLLRHGIRLLTLTGPAGVGKTRLALAVAASVVEHFTHGAIFVDLAPLADPGLVLPRIAEGLGIQPSADQPPLTWLATALRDQQRLLVVDNCEHMLATGPELASLLAACPTLTILTTSRAPLRLRGEHEQPVLPLSDRSGARLFKERARAVRPDLGFDHAGRQVVQRICRRPDGLPLAIELAAARCRVLEPYELLARLVDSMKLLTGGELDRPIRHRTLRASLTWSHNLLSEQEHVLFRRLAVFAGGFSLGVAERVCGLDGLDVLDTLDSLVGWSLVGRDAGRFRMLQTIREFALEKVAVADDTRHVHEQHARHCLEMAERARAELSGPREGDARQRLQAEQDEVRAALAWTAEAGRPDLGLELASVLGQFWITGGQLEEGRVWLRKLLTIPGSVPASVRTRALSAAGVLATWQDDRTAARAVLQDALGVARAANDATGAAEALSALELPACRAHDAAAVALANEALAFRRQVGDEAAVASALATLGRASASAGDVSRANQLYQESLAICRRLGDRFGVAEVLTYIGRDALRNGDFATARVVCEEALAIFRELGVRVQVAWALLLIGGSARGLRESGLAAAAYREALELCVDMPVPLWVAVALAGLGGVALDERRLERAARLLSAAEGSGRTLECSPRSGI